MVKVGLRGAPQIHEAILKNLLPTTIMSEEREREACRASNMGDLNVCEDEPAQGDKLGPSIGIKTKFLRPLPNGEFKVIQLNNNHMRTAKIEVDLPVEVNKGLIECLRAKSDLFITSPHEMPHIDLVPV